jgi:hypothetical protein
MQRVLSLLVVAWAITGLLHAGPEDNGSKAPAASGSKSASAGIGPAAPTSKGPKTAGRPNPTKYSFKIWPALLMPGGSASTDTQFGRLACSAIGGKRSCYWQ